MSDNRETRFCRTCHQPVANWQGGYCSWLCYADRPKGQPTAVVVSADKALTPEVEAAVGDVAMAAYRRLVAGLDTAEDREAMRGLAPDAGEERGVVWDGCNCAGTPPTMPTCRSEHLPSCPAYRTKGTAAEAEWWRKHVDYTLRRLSDTAGETERIRRAASKLANLLDDLRDAEANAALDELRALLLASQPARVAAGEGEVFAAYDEADLLHPTWEDYRAAWRACERHHGIASPAGQEEE